jgi:hypothetical protein
MSAKEGAGHEKVWAIDLGMDADIVQRDQLSHCIKYYQGVEGALLDVGKVVHSVVETELQILQGLMKERAGENPDEEPEEKETAAQKKARLERNEAAKKAREEAKPEEVVMAHEIWKAQLTQVAKDKVRVNALEKRYFQELSVGLVSPLVMAICKTSVAWEEAERKQSVAMLWGLITDALLTGCVLSAEEGRGEIRKAFASETMASGVKVAAHLLRFKRILGKMKHLNIIAGYSDGEIAARFVDSLSEDFYQLKVAQDRKGIDGNTEKKYANLAAAANGAQMEENLMEKLKTSDKLSKRAVERSYGVNMNGHTVEGEAKKKYCAKCKGEGHAANHCPTKVLSHESHKTVCERCKGIGHQQSDHK